MDILLESGFEDFEVDNLFKDKFKEDDFDSEKEYKKIDKPKAKLGDIYKLGDHILMCGDATKEEDVKKLIGNKLADMVFTDPPYDNKNESEFRNFLINSFTNYNKFTKENAPLYTCYASRTHREFEDSLEEAGYEVRNQIIWIKNIASMGWGDYRWKHEPMFYAHKKGKGINFYGDRKQYTEWLEEPNEEQLLNTIKKMIEKDESGGSTIWRMKRDTNYDHPTQKPLQLCRKAITNSTRRNQIVLDLFAGSGSTLIAAEQVQRSCYAMELDPKYVDVIIKRYEKLTDKKAKKYE
jgi:DNA modification methylase